MALIFVFCQGELYLFLLYVYMQPLQTFNFDMCQTCVGSTDVFIVMPIRVSAAYIATTILKFNIQLNNISGGGRYSV